MCGCAMIGQTMIDVKESRARTRISTFLAGLLILVVGLRVGGLRGGGLRAAAHAAPRTA